MKEEILKEMALAGYQSFRKAINELVQERVATNPIELYDRYYRLFPDSVQFTSSKLGIDFLDSSIDIKEAKSIIALTLIEEDIRSSLTKKKGYDEVLKELGIELKPADKRITNGIENCAWFKLFDSPMGLNWFSQNANKLLTVCDKEDEFYPKLEKMIESIKTTWKNINPQEPLPTLSNYQSLINRPVNPGVQALILKASGNS